MSVKSLTDFLSSLFSGLLQELLPSPLRLFSPSLQPRDISAGDVTEMCWSQIWSARCFISSKSSFLNPSLKRSTNIQKSRFSLQCCARQWKGVWSELLVVQSEKHTHLGKRKLSKIATRDGVAYDVLHFWKMYRKGFSPKDHAASIRHFLRWGLNGRPLLLWITTVERERESEVATLHPYDIFVRTLELRSHTHTQLRTTTLSTLEIQKQNVCP